MCVVVSKLFYFANNRDCSSIMLSLKHYPLASNTIKMDNCTHLYKYCIILIALPIGLIRLKDLQRNT